MAEDYAGRATYYLQLAEKRDEGVSGDAETYRQYGAAYAALAVAHELKAIREAITGVENVLTGPFGEGAGTSLSYINDWLKTMVERN